MSEKTNRELVDESQKSLVEYFDTLDTRIFKSVEWYKVILKDYRAKLYDAVVFRAYVYHLLMMNGGPITIPGSQRATDVSSPYFIRHTENEDGSCTIEIEYQDEETEE